MNLETNFLQWLLELLITLIYYKSHLELKLIVYIGLNDEICSSDCNKNLKVKCLCRENII